MPLPNLSNLSFGKKDALILAQVAQLQEALVRVAALERRLERLLLPPKTPDNSSLPPYEIRSRTIPTNLQAKARARGASGKAADAR